jgi:hypothetical protein
LREKILTFTEDIASQREDVLTFIEDADTLREEKLSFIAGADTLSEKSSLFTNKKPTDCSVGFVFCLRVETSNRLKIISIILFING